VNRFTGINERRFKLESTIPPDQKGDSTILAYPHSIPKPHGKVFVVFTSIYTIDME
jgi:hypothetical protein